MYCTNQKHYVWNYMHCNCELWLELSRVNCTCLLSDPYRSAFRLYLFTVLVYWSLSKCFQIGSGIILVWRTTVYYESLMEFPVFLFSIVCPSTEINCWKFGPDILSLMSSISISKAVITQIKYGKCLLPRAAQCSRWLTCTCIRQACGSYVCCSFPRGM